MAIHFKSVEAEDKEYQVLHLNVVGLYLVAVGCTKEIQVPADEYEVEGEVYLHQIKPKTEEEEAKRKALYDKFSTIPDSDLPPYEELIEFDDLIPLKAKYEMTVNKDGESVMKFKEIVQLQLDEQLAYDADGNLVRASVLDGDEDSGNK